MKTIKLWIIGFFSILMFSVMTTNVEAASEEDLSIILQEVELLQN